MQLDPSAFVADPELLQALESHATPIACGGEHVLFRQGDPASGVYILITGEATLSMSAESGQSLMSIHATAGSLLGLPGLIGDQPYSLTAVSDTGAQVSFIARSEFNALMQSDPQLALKILRVLAAEVRSARLALTQP
jgi:CRP-like cAMP-binding protein